jgi:hypothetical protein
LVAFLASLSYITKTDDEPNSIASMERTATGLFDLTSLTHSYFYTREYESPTHSFVSFPKIKFNQNGAVAQVIIV